MSRSFATAYDHAPVTGPLPSDGADVLAALDDLLDLEAPVPAILTSQLELDTPPAPELVITTPPTSSWRPQVSPELARSARHLRYLHDTGAHARSKALEPVERGSQTWIVAGIWLTALTLIGGLALVVMG